ncbi:hypothetical protein AVEN_93611-1 [Araneus ventricosus]|uniref:Uncharacterized protein n=1 Tax=Araneus ventricosus TaxID=182803 RepID=A0A4Y2T7F4_ARAVE|nr:hypothetical protein AVEN_93611-1 [Araneus ventricosus]
MKDELSGDIASEFVGLKAKMYSLKTLHFEKQTAKGVPKSVLKSRVSHNDYKNCLLNVQGTRESFKTITSSHHVLKTVQQNKISLCPFDDKRYILGDVDENPPKRYHWGPTKMYAPERHIVATPKVCSTEPSATTTTPEVCFVQSPATTTPEVCFPQPSTTTTASQPPTTASQPPTTASQPPTAAPQPSTTAGGSLGRDERGQQAFKTVGSWELGRGVKTSVVQSSDGGEFVNIR